EARRLESRRSLQRLHSDVIKAWHGLAVAKQSARAWAKAAEAARTARRNALSASEQGMADRSRILQARVRASEIEAELAKAKAEESLAAQSLTVLLGGFPISEDARIEGIAVDTLRLFSESLSDSGLSLALALSRTNQSLAQKDLCRARAAWLPRLNGMARLDWKGRGEMDDRDPSWTVGLAARWDLFQGLKEWGQEASARARLAMAREGLASQERMEVLERNTWTLRSQVALERLAIAQEGVEAAVEVSRIAQLKYAEGLMDQSEWLGALAEEAKAVVALEALRLEAVEALGNRAMALGMDPARMVERK
ncbi:MAG TPA: TolC family protein, partial [Fibrobacteria bacterium]|nr:TolC family protein [Fibrobacteria bacterium]